MLLLKYGPSLAVELMHRCIFMCLIILHVNCYYLKGTFHINKWKVQFTHASPTTNINALKETLKNKVCPKKKNKYLGPALLLEM